MLSVHAVAQAPPPPATEAQAEELRALIRSSPRLPLQATPLAVQVPAPDWTTDYVSSTAAGRDGTTYLLHRNPKLDPVVAIDGKGRLLRSCSRCDRISSSKADIGLLRTGFQNANDRAHQAVELGGLHQQLFAAGRGEPVELRLAVVLR